MAFDAAVTDDHPHVPSAQPSAARTARTRPPKPAAIAPIGMSNRYDKVMAGMLEVQSRIYAPPRNKTVTIKPRNAPEFQFSYTTLDVILEMLRTPMVEAKLWLGMLYVPGAKGLDLVVRVVHVQSQQWIQSVVPLPGDSSASAQGIGTATTYLRRYTIAAMFNIASDEDLDAAQAMNNGAFMVPASGEQAQRLAGQQASTLHERLVSEANSAQKSGSPAALYRMLTTWDSGMAQFFGYRDSEAREGDWTTVGELTTGAIDRVHGPLIGELWRRMLRCTTPECITELRALADEPETKAAFVAMKKAAEQNAQRIGGQLQAARARVQSQAGAPPPRAVMSEPIEPTAAYSVLDEVGEAMGEPISDPLRYVRAYVDEVRVSDRGAMAEHNADGLEWLRSQHPASWTLLQQRLSELFAPATSEFVAPPAVDAPATSELVAPPAVDAPATSELVAPPAAVDAAPATSELVAPPATHAQHRLALAMKPGGQPDIIGYCDRVKAALRRLDRDEVLPWQLANRFVYEGLPRAAHLIVMDLLATRARELGVDLV